MHYAGKRLAAELNFGGPYSEYQASWINHVTSHAFTMVTHLRQKTNVNAGDRESFEGTGLIFCGAVGG